MRIFVCGTGRCGTKTFAESCKYASNYSVAHESHAGLLDNWEYPDNHIEVSSHLLWGIPILKRLYSGAKWVWLYRKDRKACTESIAWMAEGLIVKEFCHLAFEAVNFEPIDGARCLYDCINSLGFVGVYGLHR